MMEEDRMGFAGIGPPKEDDIRIFDLLIGICPSAGSENHRQTGDAWGVSGSVTAVDVIAAHDDTRKLLRNEIHFICRLRATEHTERFRSVSIDRRLQTGDCPV
jgi:hypothetical protein